MIARMTGSDFLRWTRAFRMAFTFTTKLQRKRIKNEN